MTVKELCEQLQLKVIVKGEQGKTVAGGYTGDLLSWVMARLPEDAVWLTVMGNINTVAVASLKDAACIILTESAPLDEDAQKKAQQQGIPVFSSPKSSFELGAELARILR